MSYKDLINIDDFEKRDNFNDERGEVSFYCKDCEEIIQAERPNPNGYLFKCPKCGGNNIAIGTYAGLKENYRIKG